MVNQPPELLSAENEQLRGWIRPQWRNQGLGHMSGCCEFVREATPETNLPRQSRTKRIICQQVLPYTSLDPQFRQVNPVPTGQPSSKRPTHPFQFQSPPPRKKNRWIPCQTRRREADSTASGTMADSCMAESGKLHRTSAQL